MRLKRRQKLPWCTYAQNTRICAHIHTGIDTFTYSLTPRSVAAAQLCCGRREDCDSVRARRRWRLLPGSFLMVELTFTLGGCGLWLLLLQKWFNLPCGIQRNLFWWMKTATVKVLEMSGGCECMQYLNLPTHCIWHDCNLSHLGAMLTVILDNTWRKETENRYSMSVESPDRCLPSHVLLNNTQAHCSSRRLNYDQLKNKLPPHLFSFLIKPDSIPLLLWQSCYCWSHIFQTMSLHIFTISESQRVLNTYITKSLAVMITCLNYDIQLWF